MEIIKDKGTESATAYLSKEEWIKIAVELNKINSPILNKLKYKLINS